jgi:hypothetical protein
MREIEIIKRAYHFPGLSVIVPDQIDREIGIMPVDLTDRMPEDIPEVTDNFEKIRYVANLALFRVDHAEQKYYEEPIQEFDPPIEIRVGYTEEDVSQAKGDFHNLKLAYWDMEKWVILSDPAFEYQILPPSTARILEAKIWSWVGDPAIAVGK